MTTGHEVEAKARELAAQDGLSWTALTADERIAYGDRARVILTGPKHYTMSDVIDLSEAVAYDDGRWRKTILTLREGDTAWRPDSTKHVVHGPAKLRYQIHPLGILLDHV